MCDGHGRHNLPRGSLPGALRNLAAGDRPLPERLKLVAQAYWRRVSRAQVCCGYYGEPGC